MNSKHSIETVTGKYVDIADPKPEMIDVIDISWGLSSEPRFCGQTRTTLPYSVGQHSMVVANFMRRLFVRGDPLRANAIEYFVEKQEHSIADFLVNCPFEVCPKVFIRGALFHDASEAYLRDIPTPIKNLPGLKEEYHKVEDRLTTAINKKLELDPSSNTLMANYAEQYHALLHYVDVYARVIEAYHMMKSRGLSWGCDVRPENSDLMAFKGPLPASEVNEKFLATIELVI